MSSKQILNKIIAIESQISTEQLINYKINQTQWKKIQAIIRTSKFDDVV